MTEAEKLIPATGVEVPAPKTPEAAKPEGEGDTALAAEERTKLEARLTERGREQARVEAERDRLAAELAEAKSANEKWDEWYHGPEGPAKPEEKVKFQAERQIEERAAPQLEVERSRANLLEALATEADPTVRKALNAVYASSKASGRYPDAQTIKAFADSIRPESPSGEEAKPELARKPAPNVTPNRSTRSVEVSIDSRIAEQEKLIKEGKASPGSIMGLMFEKQQAEKAARGV